MHAPTGRAIPWILAFSLVLALGCRGANPFSRQLQVTKSSDPNVPEIQSPPQRLATAKPRTGEPSRSSSQPTSQSTAAPVATASQGARPASASVELAGAQQPSAKPTQSEKPATSTVAASDSSKPPTSAAATADKAVAASDEKSSPDKPGSDPQDPADEPVEVKVAAVEAQPASESGPDKPIEAMTRDELLIALNDFPPELREQALRQFVAVVAKSAGQTNQPNAFASELAKKINDLPALPDPASTPSATPPTRLAAVQSKADGAAPATESVADSQAGRNPGVTASLSDNRSRDLKSAEVQAISDSTQTDPAAVTTASAARDANESPMVSQAIGAASANDSSSVADAGQQTKLQSEQELLDALVKRLATASPGESEADRNSRLIKLRHLMVLAGDPDSAVEAVEGMAEAEQEYLRHQLLGLWTMIDPQGHPVPSRRFSTAIPQIREAAKFAAAATDSLEVRALAFCTEIESYGQIKPFAGNRFDAGQQVILYCEIENFTAQRVENGYQTHLQGSYDVYNANNQKVFSQVLPADKQVSANYLRDYFIAYQMFLPSELQPGTYRLQLTMEDANGKKYGQSSIPFEVAK